MHVDTTLLKLPRYPNVQYSQALARSSIVVQCFHLHDDVIKWKPFPRYWPFVRGIHRSPVNSPHKGQWRGALMFYLICVWINGWVNNREAGDLRRYRAHYDVTEMHITFTFSASKIPSWFPSPHQVLPPWPYTWPARATGDYHCTCPVPCGQWAVPVTWHWAGLVCWPGRRTAHQPCPHVAGRSPVPHSFHQAGPDHCCPSRKINLEEDAFHSLYSRTNNCISSFVNISISSSSSSSIKNNNKKTTTTLPSAYSTIYFNHLNTQAWQCLISQHIPNTSQAPQVQHSLGGIARSTAMSLTYFSCDISVSVSLKGQF